MARHKEFDPEVALDRALDLFWSRGFAATSMQDLTDHLGISRRSLYDTFGSKHELYVRALDRYAERESAALLAPLASEAPVAEALRTVLVGLCDAALADDHRRGCFLVNAAMECVPGDVAVTERVARSFAGLEQAVRDAVSRGQARGELGTDRSPDDVARFLVAVIHGLRVSGKADPDHDRLAATVDLALMAI